MTLVSVKNALCDNSIRWYTFTDITYCFMDITCCFTNTKVVAVKLEIMFHIQYLLVKIQWQFSIACCRPCSKREYQVGINANIANFCAFVKTQALEVVMPILHCYMLNFNVLVD